MSTVLVLPDSRQKTVLTPKGSVNAGVRGMAVPIYCINCGKFGGYVPEENITGVSYLCDDPCSAKFGNIPGTVGIPDRVFWELVKQTQIETYGRELQPEEIEIQLGDPNSLMSKLARDRKLLTPKPGA